MNTTKLKNQSGVIAILTLLAVSVFALLIMTTMSVLAADELKMSSSEKNTEKTFYAAEAGINEALYRLSKNGMPDNFCLSFEGTVINCSQPEKIIISITADPLNPYNRIINSSATDLTGKIRNLAIVAKTSTYVTSLNYAVHAGAGGLIIAGNGSEVLGNVFANGSIIPENNGITGNIKSSDIDPVNFPGNVKVSGINSIEQMNIDGSAYASLLKGRNSKPVAIAGDAYYQTIDQNQFVEAHGLECITASSNAHCHNNTPPLSNEPLPISDTDINKWTDDIKTAVNESLTNGTGQTLGSTNVSGNQTWIPTKITGNLTFSNNAQLLINGPLWITGNIILSNNSRLTLTNNIFIEGNLNIDNNTSFQLAASLGEKDGIVIVKGNITVNNGVAVNGSGNEKSSLSLITTYASANLNDPSILASNTSTGVIYYAHNATNTGLVRVSQTGDLSAVLADTIYLENNAIVRFRPKLQLFSVSDPDPEPILSVTNSWQEK